MKKIKRDKRSNYDFDTYQAGGVSFNSNDPEIPELGSGVRLSDINKLLTFNGNSLDARTLAYYEALRNKYAKIDETSRVGMPYPKSNPKGLGTYDPLLMTPKGGYTNPATERSKLTGRLSQPMTKDQLNAFLPDIQNMIAEGKDAYKWTKQLEAAGLKAQPFTEAPANMRTPNTNMSSRGPLSFPYVTAQSEEVEQPSFEDKIRFLKEQGAVALTNPAKFSQLVMQAKSSMSDTEVKKLQEMLNRSGATTKKLATDGKWGNQTQQAVEQYLDNIRTQKYLNSQLKSVAGFTPLVEDGIIGNKTKAAMELQHRRYMDNMVQTALNNPMPEPPPVVENQMIQEMPAQFVEQPGDILPLPEAGKFMPIEYACGGMVYDDMFKMMPRHQPHLYMANGGNFMDPRYSHIYALSGLGMINSLLDRAPYERRKDNRFIREMNNAGFGKSQNPVDPFGNYTVNKNVGLDYQANTANATQDFGTSFQEGGEYELTDQEIQQILRMGGTVEYL